VPAGSGDLELLVAEVGDELESAPEGGDVAVQDVLGGDITALDRDPADPKWILATIATPDEIRPARPDATVDEVIAVWVASATGLFRPALTPLPGALTWRVDEGGKPR